MGLVYLANKGLIRKYPEGMVDWTKSLIQPGQAKAAVKAAELTAEEVEIILLKLDQLAMSKQHEAIATMLAEEAESILLAIRMVKEETKEPFLGMLGVGSNLEMLWLRPKDVGSTTLLNSAGTAGLGLYSGTSAGVYTWLKSFIAGTSADIIPEQTMVEEAAVLHLGGIDTVEIPKLESITFTLAGIPAPAQSLPFNLRKSVGATDLPFVRFEKPIIVGPEKKQKVAVMPNITGDSKFQLLSLLIAKASSLTA